MYGSHCERKLRVRAGVLTKVRPARVYDCGPESFISVLPRPTKYSIRIEEGRHSDERLSLSLYSKSRVERATGRA